MAQALVLRLASTAFGDISPVRRGPARHFTNVVAVALSPARRTTLRLGLNNTKEHDARATPSFFRDDTPDLSRSFFNHHASVE